MDKQQILDAFGVTQADLDSLPDHEVYAAYQADKELRKANAAAICACADTVFADVARLVAGPLQRS